MTSASAIATSNTFDNHDELRSMVSFVGRAGWLASDRTMLYALGGGALGHFVVPDSQDLRGGDRGKWVGYTAGAGVEHKFTPNWSVRAEYRYLHFDVDRQFIERRLADPGAGDDDVHQRQPVQPEPGTSFDSHIGKIALGLHAVGDRSRCLRGGDAGQGCKACRDR